MSGRLQGRLCSAFGYGGLDLHGCVRKLVYGSLYAEIWLGTFAYGTSYTEVCVPTYVYVLLRMGTFVCGGLTTEVWLRDVVHSGQKWSLLQPSSTSSVNHGTQNRLA